MEISPELRKLPEAAQQFPAGLAISLLWGALVTQKPRDFFSDAEKYLKRRKINLTGIKNIPKNGGALLAFNHPQIPILIDGMIKLSYEIHHSANRDDLTLVIGSEIPMFEWFGTGYLPGSPKLLEHLFSLYGQTIIPVPTKKERKDYRMGRDKAYDTILNYLDEGRLVAFSPEARVELDNKIVDSNLFRRRAGEIAIIAAQKGIPQIPINIGVGNDKTRVTIGKPFFVQSTLASTAVVELMDHVASLS